MQYDLKFLRAAMIDEGIPVQVDEGLPRGDILHGADYPLTQHTLFMHPMMLLELMWREQPRVWLAKIEAEVVDRATRQADAAIERLERDGEEA